MPRPFTPRSRAEAIAAPLEDVREAARADKSYLYGLAVIVADLIKPAEVSEPAPANETPEARSHRALLGQVARRSAA